jgi:hypothetical protein
MVLVFEYALAENRNSLSGEEARGSIFCLLQKEP